MGRPISVRNLVVFPGGFIFLHPITSTNGLMYTAINFMRLIPVARGTARRHVNFASGLVMNRTCMGLLEEHIICVG
jgi:hypothetical protein